MPKVPPARPQWGAGHSAGLLAIVAAIVLVGAMAGRDRLVGWVATTGLLLGFAAVAGHGTTGLWRGALIDSRNKISLSRLQALGWTVLILSAVYAATLSNIASRQPRALSVSVPEGVWLLMGLGVTSLAATPMIRSVKAARTADAGEEARTLGVLASRRGGPAPAASFACVGQVVVNTRAEDATWADLVAGEDVGNASVLDLGKLQLLFVSLILAIVYAAALASLFAGAEARIDSLPTPDNGLVALLGVSHAGYLAAKAAPQGRPGP